MVLLRLNSMALSRSRFALSPLAETLGVAITLTRPCSEPWLADWHARHQQSFQAMRAADSYARGLLDLVAATKWLPGFVALPPTGGCGRRSPVSWPCCGSGPIPMSTPSWWSRSATPGGR